MKAYRAKNRIAASCRGVIGGVTEIPPDGPDKYRIAEFWFLATGWVF